MDRPAVAPGTLVVFTDIACGWSTVALHRLYRARDAAGLADRLTVDLQLFLLEDINVTALSMKAIEAEKPVVGALAPELELKAWQGDPSEFPVTSLLANEAVHAAKRQSPRAAEEVDMALRLAFWRDSRCISMRHEILRVAAGCDEVDVDELRGVIDSGQARQSMMDTYLRYRELVQGSPHCFLADGSDVHNPGIKFHQVGKTAAGLIVVDCDEPSVYDDLVRQAATMP